MNLHNDNFSELLLSLTKKGCATSDHSSQPPCYCYQPYYQCSDKIDCPKFENCCCFKKCTNFKPEILIAEFSKCRTYCVPLNIKDIEANCELVKNIARLAIFYGVCLDSCRSSSLAVSSAQDLIYFLNKENPSELEKNIPSVHHR